LDNDLHFLDSRLCGFVLWIILEEHEVDLLLEAPVRRSRGFSIIVRAKLLTERPARPARKACAPGNASGRELRLRLRIALGQVHQHTDAPHALGLLPARRAMRCSRVSKIPPSANRARSALTNSFRAARASLWSRWKAAAG